MDAYISVPVKPLERNYSEGEFVTVVENGKDFRFRLIEAAEKGSKVIKAIPDQRH